MGGGPCPAVPDIQLWSQFVLTTLPPVQGQGGQQASRQAGRQAGTQYRAPARAACLAKPSQAGGDRTGWGENQCGAEPRVVAGLFAGQTLHSQASLPPVKATIFIRICPSIAHYTFIMGFIDPPPPRLTDAAGGGGGSQCTVTLT